MNNFVVKALVLLALPTVIIVGADLVIAKLSGRQQVKSRLRNLPAAADRRMLGMRLCGYDADEVSRHWGALAPDTFQPVRTALELDLIFPFFYGGAIAAALLAAWVALERPFPPVWLILPVAITMVADWTENFIQLGQLSRFEASGEAGLHRGWIQIASLATTTKLVFYFGSSLLLVGLVVWILARGVTPRS